MRRVLVYLVVGAFLTFVPGTSLLAQGALSEVNGTAADQSGAVLPGVTVTLTEETTGLVRTVITNEAGRWVLPALQPGRYAVKAELAGFQTQNRTGVVVNDGRSEEHTSELQSRQYLVCRLLLEKKKQRRCHMHPFLSIEIRELR